MGLPLTRVTSKDVPDHVLRKKLNELVDEINLGMSLFLSIPKGDIAGHAEVLKFGRNEAVGTTQEDVVDAGGTYGFYPTTAIACDIGSTSASDASMSVEVFGLSLTGALQDETVVLDGTDPSVTRVPLANNYWRIYRAINRSASDNAGTVTIEADGGGGGVADDVVAAQITIGFNQTLMTAYTIPVGKTGYMVQWGASADRGTGNPASIDMELRVREASSVSVREVFAIKSHHGLDMDATTHFQHKFNPFFKISALSDIIIRSEANTGTADVHADFDLILVDD